MDLVAFHVMIKKTTECVILALQSYKYVCDNGRLLIVTIIRIKRPVNPVKNPVRYTNEFVTFRTPSVSVLGNNIDYSIKIISLDSGGDALNAIIELNSKRRA